MNLSQNLISKSKMRVTLKQRWDAAKEKIDGRIKEYLESYDREHFKEFIEVSPNGTITVSECTGIRYSDTNVSYWHHYGKNPTTKEVEEIEAVANGEINFSMSKIYFGYHRFSKWGAGTTGSHSLLEIDTHPMLFTDKKLAEELSIELKNKLAQEQEKIDAGTHERCQRCGRLTETNQIVQHLIFGGAQRGMKTMMRFCSGTCAGHEQMSREG